MNNQELSLLLYFETCLVDNRGRTECVRMNTDDFDIAEKFNEQKLIEFGRLKMKEIDSLKYTGKNYTHYVRFTDKAWKIAHTERRERSKRMIQKLT